MHETRTIRGEVAGHAYSIELHGDHWHVVPNGLPDFTVPLTVAPDWPVTVQPFAEDWIRRMANLRRERFTAELPRE